MLPLLALIAGGASLVDGLDSVQAVERLGLVVDPTASDPAGPTVEPHFFLPKENDSSSLMSSRALDDFRIEHDDTVVNRLAPQDTSAFTVPVDMTENAIMPQSPVDEQAFPCWPGAPGITYREFATWLGGVNQLADSSHVELGQPFPFNVDSFVPDRVVGRPIYAGMIDDGLVHWLENRIADARQSAFGVEPSDGSVAEFEQPYPWQVDEISMEARRQNLSGLVELLRGGMIIAGLSEPHNPGAAMCSGRLAPMVGGRHRPGEQQKGLCNYLGYRQSNEGVILPAQWSTHHESRGYFRTDVRLFFADGQLGSQLANQ